MRQVDGILKIELLGALRVRIGNKLAEFDTDAQRILLAYLAAHQGQPQRRDTLAGLLSPDRPDKEALTYLRNRLARLRRTLGEETAVSPYLDIDRKQITLRTGSDISIDVTRFEQRLTTVENHPHRQLAGCPTCLATLKEAVGLVRGEFLAGLNFPSDTWEAWLLAQREHVQQRTLAALTWLREAQMARGELTAVLDIAQRQLALEPWQEAAHRAIMLAHFQLGDRTAALAQYEQCEKHLWEELGVDPEDETLRLRQQILDQTLTPGSATEIPNNLPLQTGPFVGRKAEQAQLLQRLVDPTYRLITLVGAGGIGKTRLSLEVGQQVRASFPDGVWFVPLDAVKGGTEQIKMAVGEAAGLAHDDKQLTGEQVLAILRDKRMLLIFDNSEVALDDVAFIPEWLRRAPQIAILATSREPLNLQAEAVLTLTGLPMGEAEALFAERGRMARADFAVTPENLSGVRHICQLVDGSPLGIGLAAAWVRRRSLGQIVEEIGRSLDFLSARLRDIDPRHRSMRAVLDTSWQLLTPEEQAILAALSVFPATFSAEAATQISGATLFDLDLLCEKSLLQQQQESERYFMHSLVRQFSAEKLSTHAAEVNRQFVNYFYQYACTYQADYQQLQLEWGNFAAGIQKAHAALAWQTVLDFVRMLDEPRFRQIRLTEMREGLTLALEAATALHNKADLAWVLLRLGQILVEQSDYAAAENQLTRALQHYIRAENGFGIASANYWLGRTALEKGQDDQTIALCTESLHIFESEGDRLGVAQNLNLLALCHIRKYGDYQAALADLEKSVLLQRGLPPTASYVETLRHLARVKSVVEEFEVAASYLLEATQVAQQQQDIGEYAAVLYERLLLCKKRKQFAEALTLGYESLENFRLLGSLRWEALLKTQLGLLHQAQQNPLQALGLLNAGLQLFMELGDIYEQAYSQYYLYRLYAEIDQPAQSLLAKEQAARLNLKLEDTYLAQLLA